MKKLFFFFALAFLFSCDKETCYECKTYTYSKPYELLIDVETETICVSEELELLDYQTDHYVFADTYYSTCECKEK